MLIKDYFQRLKTLISNNNQVVSYQIIPDYRSSYRGFIKGQIKFINNSELSVREFVNVEDKIERTMYSYQYMNSDNKLIFRYDNTRHHHKLKLSTFPHHKHEGSQDNIIASHAPFLE